MFAASAEFTNFITFLVICALIAMWNFWRQEKINEWSANGEKKPWWF